MNLELNNLKDATLRELKDQIEQDSELIVRRTPLDSEDWDDPEDYQFEAVRLAHAIVELSNRDDREDVDQS